MPMVTWVTWVTSFFLKICNQTEQEATGKRQQAWFTELLRLFFFQLEDGASQRCIDFCHITV